MTSVLRNLRAWAVLALVLLVTIDSSWGAGQVVLLNTLNDHDDHRLWNLDQYTGKTRASIERYFELIRKDVESLMDTKDGPKAYLRIADSPEPNAMIEEARDGAPILTLNRGLLEMMGDDDELGSVIQHEFKHRHARIHNPWKGVEAPPLLRRMVEPEADVLGIDELIEKGRNPWGMIDLFNHLMEYEEKRGGDPDAISRTHAQTMTRKNAVAARITQKIRGEGVLQRFRLDSPEKRKREITDFGLKSVFQDPSYLQARKEQVQAILKSGGERAHRSYAPLKNGLQGKERDPAFHFNWDAQDLWQKVERSFPFRISHQDRFAHQVALNRALMKTYEQTRTELLGPDFQPRSVAQLEYLMRADRRPYFIDLTSVAETRKRLLKVKNRRDEVIERLNGLEGRIPEAKQAMDEEIRELDRKLPQVERENEDAISMLKRVEDLEEEEGTQKKIPWFHLDSDVKHDDSRQWEEKLDGRVREKTTYMGHPTGEFEYPFAYWKLQRHYGFQIPELHGELVENDEVGNKLELENFHLYTDPGENAEAFLKRERTDSFFPGDVLSDKQVQDFTDAVEKRLERELKAAKAASDPAAATRKVVSNTSKMLERFGYPLYATAGRDSERKVELSHPKTQRLAAFKDRVYRKLVAEAGSADEFQGIQSAFHWFKDLLPKEKNAELEALIQNKQDELVYREVWKDFESALRAENLRESLSALREFPDQELMKKFRQLSAGAKERLKKEALSRVSTQVQGLLKATLGHDVALREAENLVLLQNKFLSPEKWEPGRGAAIRSTLKSLSENRDFQNEAHSLISLGRTNDFMTEGAKNHTERQARYRRFYELFSKSPAIFTRDSEYREEGVTGIGDHKVVDGFQKHFLEEEAKKKSPHLQALSEIFNTNSYHRDGSALAQHFWTRYYENRLEEHRKLPKRKQIAEATYDFLKYLEENQLNFQNSDETRHLDYHIAEHWRPTDQLREFKKATTLNAPIEFINGIRKRRFDINFYLGYRDGVERIAKEVEAQDPALRPEELRPYPGKTEFAHRWPHDMD